MENQTTEIERHPNSSELEILNLAYTRFFSIYGEFILDKFWTLPAEMRLFKLKNCFEIYAELLKYKPIKWYVDYLKVHRPPKEGFIASEYFLFIRNVLCHFPYFCCWNDIFINEKNSSWNGPANSSIQRFIKKYSGLDAVKYRIWDNDKQKYTYLDVGFPSLGMDKIFLKDLISEKEGMFFCMILMKNVLESQIEK